MVEAGLNHDPLVGATLGGLYHVERLIGVGGMGRVYEATHTHLGKAYAVKVLPEGRADKPEATERFLREAKSATKIEHEHIVKIVNFDSDDEHRLFIVMELLEGENLADRLDQGALPVDEAIEIAKQTGEALQAAHDAGIVHRDLKPENIFLTQKHGRDFVKVLDFGISKIKNPDHGDPKLTATDQIVGTPLYISPELARGVAIVDHRTDIYALGVILYEMITGTPPFTGQNHFQLLYKHGNEAPDPPSQRSKKANIPPHVESAVLRALEKNPADRFDSMRDLCAALEGPPIPRRARTLGIPLLAAAIVAGVAVRLVADDRARNAPRPADPRAARCDTKVRRPRTIFRGRTPGRTGEDRARFTSARCFHRTKRGQKGQNAAGARAGTRGGGDGTVFASGVPQRRTSPGRDRGRCPRGSPQEENPPQATSD